MKKRGLCLVCGEEDVLNGGGVCELCADALSNEDSFVDVMFDMVEGDFESNLDGEVLHIESDSVSA